MDILFKDLAKLEFKPWDHREFLEYMASVGLTVPWEVALQFYFDHRDKEEFVSQYGHLDLRRLEWRTEDWSAEVLLQVSMYSPFVRWTDVVARKAKNLGIEGFSAMDSRSEVVAHWENQGTWRVPPILIDGTLVRPPSSGPRLVEGHTRIGCLRGLVGIGALPPESMHKVFFGRY